MLLISAENYSVLTGLEPFDIHGNGRTRGADPIWTASRVPNGFWDSRANRVAYMRWLGSRLGYTKPDDWYALTRRCFQQNFGWGLLKVVYNDSPQAAMQDFMPRRHWWPWLFSRTPQGFWQEIRNRRAFISWLEGRLGIEGKEGWYRVTKQDFLDHGGAGLLHNYYGDSVAAALRELRPRLKMHEWRFKMVPQGFWTNTENRRRYMDWLAEQLEIRTPELWYGVTSEDVRRNHGITLLTLNGGSVYRMVSEYLPDRDWKPWLFSSAPSGFWRSSENRRNYLRWLGDELGFRRPADWYALTHRHFKRTGGSWLFSMHYGSSRLQAARERYPKYPWIDSRFEHYPCMPRRKRAPAVRES